MTLTPAEWAEKAACGACMHHKPCMEARAVLFRDAIVQGRAEAVRERDLPHDINGELWIGYCDLCNGQHCLQVLAANAQIERSPHRPAPSAGQPSGDAKGK